MIYTFYSYKGGVGRSMAMANVGELFYQAGLNVLLVDWDLEAPGLERFFALNNEKTAAQPGVIDLLLDYKHQVTQEWTTEDGQYPFTKPADITIDLHRDSPKGQLKLLTAGQRDKANFARYANAVLTFDWKDFYDNWEGEAYFEWLREQFLAMADVVLIDSRTGITEMGGVCTYQLADVVVAFCTASQQSLNGTTKMLKDLMREKVQEARQRPLRVIAVPARIEQSEGDFLNQFKRDFLNRFSDIATDSLGFTPEQLWELGIPYIPHYAYEETCPVQESEAIAQEISRAFKLLTLTLSRLANRDSKIYHVFPVVKTERPDVIGATVVGERIFIGESVSFVEGPDPDADLIAEYEAILYLLEKNIYYRAYQKLIDLRKKTQGSLISKVDQALRATKTELAIGTEKRLFEAHRVTQERPTDWVAQAQAWRNVLKFNPESSEAQEVLNRLQVRAWRAIQDEVEVLMARAKDAFEESDLPELNACIAELEVLNSRGNLPENLQQLIQDSIEEVRENLSLGLSQAIEDKITIIQQLKSGHQFIEALDVLQQVLDDTLKIIVEPKPGSKLAQDLKQLKQEKDSILYLYYNQLTVLPPEISQLTALTELDLSDNQLTALPPEIGQLTALIKLNLNRNQLTVLSPEIGQLTTLTSLDLSENQLTTLPPEISQLTALSNLDLRENQLTALPPEIGQLTALTQLNLNGNQLTALPPEIGQLTVLTSLDISDNQLTALPPEIGQLTNLTYLDLRDNSDLPLPPEILEKTDEPQAIIKAWRDYLVGQTQPLHETKLVLVGEGSVGKTSLVNRLLHDTFDPHSEKTEGIAIHRWEIANEQMEEGASNSKQPASSFQHPASSIQVNVWDFGGQEIMHATQQFFLTERTLYVLVLDSRLTEAENRLNYWLTIIRSFGGDSPILVVGNKCDQHPLDLDRRGLLAEHPTVQAIVDTSCKTGVGIEALRAAIAAQVAQMPHVNNPIIAAWFEVKAELEEMDADTIPYHRYVELCLAHNVGNPESQRVLLGFLHDLGVVLHFPDPRLETTNILNPEWVTQGVYRILNARLPFEEQGILTWEMLTRILDDEPYQEKRMFIVDMMRKFELCYELPDRPHTYLLPDLLPKEAPDTGDWIDALRFEYHYPVLPGSILTRLIVRMHRHVHTATDGTRLAWRTGVILASEGNQALVRGDLSANRITLAIRGPGAGRRDLLTRIREHLGAIHASIADLRPAAKIPIPGHPEIPPVDYAWLRKLERTGRTEFTPPGCIDPISVSHLLNGVEPPAARRGGDTYITNVHGGQIGNLGDDTAVDDGIYFRKGDS